jgi:2-haloacid dehalogenase
MLSRAMSEPERHSVSQPDRASPAATQALLPKVTWLTFDVLGTCVDWRSTLVREAKTTLKTLDSKLTDQDLDSFAVTWLGKYAGEVGSVEHGPWKDIRTCIRNGLDLTLAQFALQGVPEATRAALCALWDRFDPWPGVVAALKQMQQDGLKLATLSNFGVAQLTTLARHAGLTWDRILSSETIFHYKPDPAVYHMAIDALGVAASQIMMVAAHAYDLRAAQAQGFATAYVASSGEGDAPQPDDQFDLCVKDFTQLAARLAAP